MEREAGKNSEGHIEQHDRRCGEQNVDIGHGTNYQAEYKNKIITQLISHLDVPDFRHKGKNNTKGCDNQNRYNKGHILLEDQKGKTTHDKNNQGKPESRKQRPEYFFFEYALIRIVVERLFRSRVACWFKRRKDF